MPICVVAKLPVLPFSCLRYVKKVAAVVITIRSLRSRRVDEGRDSQTIAKEITGRPLYLRDC
jgi:hypothetical protein